MGFVDLFMRSVLVTPVLNGTFLAQPYPQGIGADFGRMVSRMLKRDWCPSALAEWSAMYTGGKPGMFELVDADLERCAPRAPSPCPPAPSHACVPCFRSRFWSTGRKRALGSREGRSVHHGHRPRLTARLRAPGRYDMPMVVWARSFSVYENASEAAKSYLVDNVRPKALI
jgi:hypothetical protein